MIKLYGFFISNYYNMVKLACLEKGIAFEEIDTMPNQEPSFTAKSPMGKVPCLEVDGNYLSETSSILEYLEETHPSPALLPSEAMARAKVREIMKICELYIELQGRRHFPHVFFGEDLAPAAVEEVRPVVEKALRALKQVAKFDPYMAGSEFTLADIVAYYSFGYGSLVLQKVYDWDIYKELPGMRTAMDAIATRSTTQKVDADQQAAMAAFAAPK